MTTKALGLIVMLIGVGCAKPSSQLKPETLVAPNDRIGASSAADYYRNFYMGVVGKCEISTLPLYDRFLMGEVVFTENPRLRITLFLRPNYTYVAQMTGSKIIEGLWAVSRDELQLDGLGQGRAFQFNGEKAIRLWVKTDRLTGGYIEFDLTMSLIEQTHDAANLFFKPYAEQFTAACVTR